MKRAYFIFLIIGVISISLVSCKARHAIEIEEETPANNNIHYSGKTLRKVTFLPYWVPTAQFAGYFVAKETGIYEKYGIDLEIIPFQPYYTSYNLMKTGGADFATLWLSSAIKIKTSGIDIVNIAQFSTRSSLMLISKKSSGIDKIEKMNKKKAGIWIGFELQPITLFKKYNLDVRLIPIGSTNNLFLKDGVDITVASWFDEYHSIINSGYDAEELNTFFFADYGLNFLEDGIYCLSDTMKRNPGLCADFVNATMEGWNKVFENPEKAIDIVVKYAKKSNIPVNRIHQQWIIDRYRDLYYHNGKYTTTLNKKDYLSTCRILKEGGEISNIPPFETFYMPYNAK
jgi:NitT/TauT family transport system substrate-binding protein